MNAKKIIRVIIKYLVNSDYRFAVNSTFGIYNSMDDKEYLCKLFKSKMGWKLDLSNPKTFNEKLQWLKLHDRKPEYTMMVDKYEVKKYIAEKIGKEYLIPTLGIWDSFDEIDFDTLPNQFVLKCTHDSGGLVICRDKTKLNKAKARAKINKSLKRNFYYMGREWPYKDVKPRIIAEQYMEDSETKELRDYKFFCFAGVPRALYIATDRGGIEETKFDFFDMDFNHLPFTNGHPNANPYPKKPKSFELMINLASILSKDIPHVRVDFYEADGQVYFGEMTFYHWSGFTAFDPPEWDTTFGDWIEIPAENTIGKK